MVPYKFIKKRRKIHKNTGVWGGLGKLKAEQGRFFMFHSIKYLFSTFFHTNCNGFSAAYINSS